jgi:hypothetical protein
MPKLAHTPITTAFLPRRLVDCRSFVTFLSVLSTNFHNETTRFAMAKRFPP